MALGDRQHVEAVAIMRRLVEEWPTPSDMEAVLAAEQWLRENQPPSEAYMRALQEAADA